MGASTTGRGKNLPPPRLFKIINNNIIIIIIIIKDNIPNGPEYIYDTINVSI
jgi:hypothetical protein